jgi:hypothetical protein
VKFNKVDAFSILNKHPRRIISVEIHHTMGLTHINLVNNSTSCQKFYNLFKIWVNIATAPGRAGRKLRIVSFVAERKRTPKMPQPYSYDL